MNIKISKKIFRDYDIRGVYPDDMNEDIAYLIGKALGTDLFSKNITNIVLGRDDRESSPSLAKNIIKGILEAGCNVTYIDITLTPIIHYLTCAFNFDAGVMVTASHNPKEFNGIRIDLKNAVSYYGEDLQRLYAIIELGKYSQGMGIYREEPLSLKYTEFIKENFFIRRRMKVIIDCGSGASSFLAPKIFKELGMDIEPVYCSYDSNFPHGVPDPENNIFLEELKNHVIKHKGDIGIGFDTDGDRFGIVDEKGNSYSNDYVLMLFSKYVLLKNPGATVVYDVKCSQLLEEVIPNFNGVPKMIRTGHPYLFKETSEGKAILGAEYSGHMFFADKYYGYDDGIYSSCRVLELMDNTGLPLSKLMDEFPRREATSEIKLPCSDENKFKVIDKLKKILKTNIKEDRLTFIDGVRVKLSSTGWFLIRASNTSPYISVRAEGRDKKELNFILKQVKIYLSGYDEIELGNLQALLIDSVKWDTI